MQDRAAGLKTSLEKDLLVASVMRTGSEPISRVFSTMVRPNIISLSKKSLAGYASCCSVWE